MVAVEVEKGLERLRQRAESGRAQRTRLQRFNALEIRHPTPGNRMLRAKPACAPPAPRVYCAASCSATHRRYKHQILFIYLCFFFGSQKIYYVNYITNYNSYIKYENYKKIYSFYYSPFLESDIRVVPFPMTGQS